MKKFGKSMKSTGQNMTKSLTMPLLALGGASVKLASDFETSMTKISTLVGASAKDLKEYEKGIMQLSEQVGISAKDLADGMFFITSSGFEGAEALEALEISAKASSMGMGEMSSISNALTSIMTAYADEQMTAAKAGDLLHETLKQGKFDAGQFMDSLGSVIPVAAGAGVSMEELGAASATMSKLSGDAAGTLTAMRSLMLSLLKPSEKQKEILAGIGMTSEQLGRMMDESLLGTMQHLFTSLDGNNEALFNMFGSSKAVVGALSTMGLQSETYTKVLDGMNNSVGNINEGFNTLSGTSGFKFKQTLVKLQNVGIEIGNILLPIVIDLADGFKNLLNKFNQLSPDAKKMSVVVGILAGALGPLLVVLGSVMSIVAVLSIKIIAIVAALAALALGILFVNDNWEAFKERFKDIDWWRNALLEMIAVLIEFNPMGLLQKGFNSLLETLGVKIPNPFEETADFFRDMKVELKDYENDFDDFSTFIGNQGKKIKKALNIFGDGLGIGGGGDGVTTPKSGTAPVTDAPIQNNSLQNILDSVKFINKEQSLITVPLFNKGYSVEVDEFTNLMGNITTIQEEMSQSFISFGNVLQGTFAQALQSSDGFFKSFVSGAKRAMSALLAQLAATAALNALLGGSNFGKMLGFTDIDGAGGIGNLFGGLLGKGISKNADGGLIQQPHFGLIGEAGPEVVMPLNQFLNRENNGSGAVQVFGTISGQDILLSSDRARNNRTRTRGY